MGEAVGEAGEEVAETAAGAEGGDREAEVVMAVTMTMLRLLWSVAAAAAAAAVGMVVVVAMRVTVFQVLWHGEVGEALRPQLAQLELSEAGMTALIAAGLQAADVRRLDAAGARAQKKGYWLKR